MTCFGRSATRRQLGNLAQSLMGAKPELISYPGGWEGWTDDVVKDNPPYQWKSLHRSCSYFHCPRCKWCGHTYAHCCPSVSRADRKVENLCPLRLFSLADCLGAYPISRYFYYDHTTQSFHANFDKCGGGKKGTELSRDGPLVEDRNSGRCPCFRLGRFSRHRIAPLVLPSASPSTK